VISRRCWVREALHWSCAVMYYIFLCYWVWWVRWATTSHRSKHIFTAYRLILIIINRHSSPANSHLYLCVAYARHVSNLVYYQELTYVTPILCTECLSGKFRSSLTYWGRIIFFTSCTGAHCVTNNYISLILGVRILFTI